VPEERPDAGLIASLQRMLATLLTLAHTRLELVAVEIEEQLQRAASILLWSVAAIFFGSLTVLLLAITIVIAFWDEHRLLAAGLVTAAFALVAVVAVICVQRQLRARPKLLSASVDELERDAAALDRDGA
jgi:uncharacterized membrane protein YqjE